jgi:hypothetical protein
MTMPSILNLVDFNEKNLFFSLVCVTRSLDGEVLDLGTGLYSCSFPRTVIFLVRDPVPAVLIFPGQARFSFGFLVYAGAHAAGFSCFGLLRQFQCWFSFGCCRLDLSAQPGFRSALARGRSDLRRLLFRAVDFVVLTAGQCDPVS